jgi:hypothetical protein
MELVTPVTLIVDGAERVLERLDLVFIDDLARKIVLVRLHPASRPLLVWRGDAYDAVGDWTQAQAEAKILELLGENQQETLQSLVNA